MTYSDFTIDNLEQNLGLKIKIGKLFVVVPTVEVPAWFQKSLSVSMSVGFHGEKARSEFFIAPVLLASRDLNHEKFFLFSGQKLDADASRGLTGECDFILTHSAASPVLSSPIMTVVEAKKQDFDWGIGQCAAQMVGAQLFNQKHKEKDLPIFGCVTTGEAWQFLRLEAAAVLPATVLMDSARYYITNVGQILGVLKNIVDFYEAEDVPVKS